jgi:hypothetical protein
MRWVYDLFRKKHWLDIYLEQNIYPIMDYYDTDNCRVLLYKCNDQTKTVGYCFILN